MDSGQSCSKCYMSEVVRPSHLRDYETGSLSHKLKSATPGEVRRFTPSYSKVTPSQLLQQVRISDEDLEIDIQNSATAVSEAFLPLIKILLRPYHCDIVIRSAS